MSTEEKTPFAKMKKSYTSGNHQSSSSSNIINHSNQDLTEMAQIQQNHIDTNIINGNNGTEGAPISSASTSSIRMSDSFDSDDKKNYDQRGFFTKLFHTIIRKKVYFARTMAISQVFPPLKVGFTITYVAPLVFVLSITILKEAYDDLKRWKRDIEANSQKYKKIDTVSGQLISIPSSKIRVGDLIQIETNQRVPADCILLRTTEKSGASFVRTDQLDGETDWKLRHAVTSCQKLTTNTELISMDAKVYAEAPRKHIYDFIGRFTVMHENGEEEVESLSLENTLWSNCVVASGTVIGLVIYTGVETRSALNISSPKSKDGKIDLEINNLSKFLCVLMILLSLLLVGLDKFRGIWPITLFRFTLLFSSIIPISMRVNLDMGKLIYSIFIMRDQHIPNTVVRNSSIPEELGRIDYLFSDKTGTLTQNEMVFKKIHMGSISFNSDTLRDIEDYLKESYSNRSLSLPNHITLLEDEENENMEDEDDDGESNYKATAHRVQEMIRALALCHNVTPVGEVDKREYQASSPDEIAIVKFTESVGLTLLERELTKISLRTPALSSLSLGGDANSQENADIEDYAILNIFPFTSETKRMGIIVKSNKTGKIVYYMKGADSVMSKIVRSSDWLEEECDNLACEGLRTLVFGRKHLTQAEYDEFQTKYHKAKASITDRAQNVAAVREELEKDMELLGVTGVEDKLQLNVQESLENLKNASIKVWMLTGDKVETAICIARSTKLVSRGQQIFKIISNDLMELEQLLQQFEEHAHEWALIIDGNTLQLCIDHMSKRFISVACKASAVVCCRCAPTQKAAIVKLVKKFTWKRTAAIGDGGNDVSMIQAADCGLGIVGKEGMQASLAADFSITEFQHCTRLILWHGRNSYKRSARLSQFIIHRGLIISIIQAIFSAIYYYAAIPIYTGWLLVGYSTFYTMLPVFCMILDYDVKASVVFRFPELYHELQKGRALNLKTFLIWVFLSVYQAGVIMMLGILLFENSLLRIVSITFTALILNELLMILFDAHNFNIFMAFSQLISVGMYLISIFLLPTYFDLMFMLSIHFWWKVALITFVSAMPIYLIKYIKKKIDPPAYSKLS